MFLFIQSRYGYIYPENCGCSVSPSLTNVAADRTRQFGNHIVVPTKKSTTIVSPNLKAIVELHSALLGLPYAPLLYYVLQRLADHFGKGGHVSFD